MGWLLLLGLLPAIACSSSTQPGQSDPLQGHWVGTSTTNVAYVYDFQALGRDSTNPRTGNVAPLYSLAFTTTPGGSDTIPAWYEAPKAYWGNTSVGTITDATSMTVEAQAVAPFVMHKGP